MHVITSRDLKVKNIGVSYGTYNAALWGRWEYRNRRYYAQCELYWSTYIGLTTEFGTTTAQCQYYHHRIMLIDRQHQRHYVESSVAVIPYQLAFFVYAQEHIEHISKSPHAVAVLFQYNIIDKIRFGEM